MTVYYVNAINSKIKAYKKIQSLYDQVDLDPDMDNIIVSRKWGLENNPTKIYASGIIPQIVVSHYFYGIPLIVDDTPAVECWILHGVSSVSPDMILHWRTKLSHWINKHVNELQKFKPKTVNIDLSKYLSSAESNPFQTYTNKLAITLKSKNDAYGDSFDKSLDADGLLVAKIRIGDKYNRISHLIKNKESSENNESLLDNLKDLAGYAILTWKYLKEHKS